VCVCVRVCTCVYVCVRVCVWMCLSLRHHNLSHNYHGFISLSTFTSFNFSFSLIYSHIRFAVLAGLTPSRHQVSPCTATPDSRRQLQSPRLPGPASYLVLATSSTFSSVYPLLHLSTSVSSSFSPTSVSLFSLGSRPPSPSFTLYSHPWLQRLLPRSSFDSGVTSSPARPFFTFAVSAISPAVVASVLLRFDSIGPTLFQRGHTATFFVSPDRLLCLVLDTLCLVPCALCLVPCV
jgi:hypothetical protein